LGGVLVELGYGKKNKENYRLNHKKLAYKKIKRQEPKNKKFGLLKKKVVLLGLMLFRRRNRRLSCFYV